MMSRLRCKYGILTVPMGAVPPIFRRKIPRNPGPVGAGSVIVQLHIQTHAARGMWVSSMTYSSADTTNNVAEYWGLVQGLRQAKEIVHSHLHVIEDSALVPS